MSHPILVTGAAGGEQGSTGRRITTLLREQGIPVRAFVHKLDARSDDLRQSGAEVIAGDLLNPASVKAAMHNVKRAYFTYPVADGLLDAVTIFAAAARDAELELIVNNSQFQGSPGTPEFRSLQHAASFRNLEHRLADRIFDWAQVRTVHLQAPPYFENIRALVRRSAAREGAAYLPWGDERNIVPLVGAEDVSRVAAALLASPGLPAQNVYPLISETPAAGEIVEALGRAIGKPVRYVAITDEQWADGLRGRLNGHALDHLSSLWRYFRSGEQHYERTDAIRTVTGRDPQTLDEFFRMNREAILAS